MGNEVEGVSYVYSAKSAPQNNKPRLRLRMTMHARGGLGGQRTHYEPHSTRYSMNLPIPWNQVS